MGLREPSHWLVIGAIAVVLFGAKRLPDSARALGRSLRIFRSEVKAIGHDDEQQPAAALPARAADPAAGTPAAGTPAAGAPAAGVAGQPAPGQPASSYPLVSPPPVGQPLGTPPAAHGGAPQA